jgi:hypothetical protein
MDIRTTCRLDIQAILERVSYSVDQFLQWNLKITQTFNLGQLFITVLFTQGSRCRRHECNQAGSFTHVLGVSLYDLDVMAIVFQPPFLS